MRNQRISTQNLRSSTSPSKNQRRKSSSSSSASHKNYRSIVCFTIIFASAFFTFFYYTKHVPDIAAADVDSGTVDVDGDDDKLKFHPSEKSQSLPEQMPDLQLWAAPFNHGLFPCVKPTSRYNRDTSFIYMMARLLTAAQGRDRYITVRSNGGLNQMRTGISDMVAVARIMNATLVIPQLDKRSFWKDSSIFSDIFDELHFITILKGDVRVIKELPKELVSVPHARKHFTSWGGLGYYEDIAQLYKEYQVIHVAKSDSRLANSDLPLDIQRLRCRALYHALRFSPPIENLGKTVDHIYLLMTINGSGSEPTITPQKLVDRLRSRGGRYIALHLRYEKDMLAFTGCTYGLTNAEAQELRILRENTNHWKMKNINSTEQREGGLCPLTPKEVGIFFQALGYHPSTLIYVAAGEIYGGNAHLSELKSRFPNLVFKESIVSQEELKEFADHASQTAALDYIISIESDVFIPTHSGNMARAVEGHRRFLGHRKTINPDRKGLVQVFNQLENGTLEEGSSLSHLVVKMHKNRQGGPRKRAGPLPGFKGRARVRTEESFYENPYPECICESKKYTANP